MRRILLLSVAAFRFGDVVAFSGAHLIGIGHVARDQFDNIRVKADEYSRVPV